MPVPTSDACVLYTEQFRRCLPNDAILVGCDHHHTPLVSEKLAAENCTTVNTVCVILVFDMRLIHTVLHASYTYGIACVLYIRYCMRLMHTVLHASYTYGIACVLHIRYCMRLIHTVLHAS